MGQIGLSGHGMALECNGTRNQWYLYVLVHNKGDLGGCSTNVLQEEDLAQIYEIKTKLMAAKQGNLSVTEYTNLLKNLWQEMDHY